MILRRSRRASILAWFLVFLVLLVSGLVLAGALAYAWHRTDFVMLQVGLTGFDGDSRPRWHMDLGDLAAPGPMDPVLQARLAAHELEALRTPLARLVNAGAPELPAALYSLADREPMAQRQLLRSWAGENAGPLDQVDEVTRDAVEGGTVAMLPLEEGKAFDTLRPRLLGLAWAGAADLVAGRQERGRRRLLLLARALDLEAEASRSALIGAMITVALRQRLGQVLDLTRRGGWLPAEDIAALAGAMARFTRAPRIAERILPSELAAARIRMQLLGDRHPAGYRMQTWLQGDALAVWDGWGERLQAAFALTGRARVEDLERFYFQELRLGRSGHPRDRPLMVEFHLPNWPQFAARVQEKHRAFFASLVAAALEPHRQGGTLPASSDQVAGPVGELRDPSTGAPYAIRPRGDGYVLALPEVPEVLVVP